MPAPKIMSIIRIGTIVAKKIRSNAKIFGNCFLNENKTTSEKAVALQKRFLSRNSKEMFQQTSKTWNYACIVEVAKVAVPKHILQPFA